MTKNKTNQKPKILALYIIFFASIFSIFIPIGFTSIFATMISVCTLSVIYSMRASSEEDSLSENHMTYLIRSFWRANLYLLLSGMLSFLYLTIFANYLPLAPCISFVERNFASLINGNPSDIITTMEICYKPFLNANHQHLVITAFIALSPILIYLAFRGIRGWAFVIKNKLIPYGKL